MNYPVDRTDINLFQNLRTDVHVFVRNIDRKPVVLGGNQVPFIQIYDPAAKQILVEKQLAAVDASDGLWAFHVAPADLTDWTERDLTYVVMILDTSTQVKTPLYTDRGYTPSGFAFIKHGPLAPPTDPITLDINDFLQRDTVLYSDALPGAVAVGNHLGQHTATFYGDHFWGTLTIQGSLEDMAPTDDSQWADILAHEETELTGPRNLSFEGNFLWVRFKLEFDLGGPDSLTQILYRAQ